MGALLKTEDLQHQIIFADFDTSQRGKELRLIAPDGGLLYEGTIISPQDILKQSFDYIIVFSFAAFGGIY